MRVLMQLLQTAMDWVDELPITAEAAQTAIEEQRDVYRPALNTVRWNILVQTYVSKQFDNEDESLQLLLSRCLMEYRYYDESQRLVQWCDVHPLIEGFDTFQTTLSELTNSAEGTDEMR